MVKRGNGIGSWESSVGLFLLVLSLSASAP
ncbi:hypothetical protein CGRA01v4_03435 [Colletotrichum graminicola]|nr:hypothetical protein CGRA01v4_03435 [Colletotrichum graminicola]